MARRLIRRSGFSVLRSSAESVCSASMMREKVPGQVNPKANRMGLVKLGSELTVSGTLNELEPSTGVTALP